MFDLGGGELLLILIAVLILFGPKKLPELAQGLGKGLRQFRQAQREFTDQINTAFEDEQRKNTAARARPGAVNTIARSSENPSDEENRIGDAVSRESEPETNGQVSGSEAQATGDSADGGVEREKGRTDG